MLRDVRKHHDKDATIAEIIEDIEIVPFAPGAYSMAWRLDPKVGITCLDKYISSANVLLENRRANGREDMNGLLEPIINFLESPGAPEAIRQNYAIFANRVYPAIQKLGWEQYLQKIGLQTRFFQNNTGPCVEISINRPTRDYSFTAVLKY